MADDSLSVNSLHAELIRRLQSIGNMQPPPEALQCLEVCFALHVTYYVFLSLVGLSRLVIDK